MLINVCNMAGQQVSTVAMEPGATLGELRVRVAADLAVGPWVKFSLLLGDRVLPDATDLALVDLGIGEETSIHVLKEPVPKVLTTSQDCTAKIWVTTTGECLLTLAGHTGHSFSAHARVLRLFRARCSCAP